MITKNIRNILMGAFALVSLAACDPNANQIIKGADLTAEVQQGDIYMGLTTHLSSNSVQILAAELPVFNPQNPAEQVGRVSITTPQMGVTDIAVEMNLTKVAKLSSLTPEKGLPNGTAFPVWGVNAGSWYSLPLNNSRNSKLYVNVDWTAQTAIVGYALVSDRLSAGLTANIFSVFNSQGVTGYGGIFSGTTPGTSGIAVFANVSSVLKAVNPTLTKSSSKIYFADRTSESRKQSVQKHLVDMNLRKAKIVFRTSTSSK